ncbi:thiol-disulfide isomerase/thioredoxin [Litorivivens lipolytica]|uniref:Thiol-disulfide isomerase/thioredoxin n=1 Tax=Litorivivens lipolytica TaxID=1524264 RepID=A0A7W4W5T5_9GAMM|nr:TlpA disulfide reductase family protein [Litorivivens lipolytica]MBB3047399.1 thiol-disulfide isomerase/thioredoxin [Litorivivens lipolytica]
MRTLIGLFLASLLLAACGADSKANRIASTDSGVYFSPGAATDRWIVINYWAKWCAPCRDEIPELNHFAEAYSDQVLVLGVNYDRLQGEALTADIRALGIAFPVLLADPHPALGIERPTALPSTLLIAPDGSLQQILLGPQTADTLLKHMPEL